METRVANWSPDWTRIAIYGTNDLFAIARSHLRLGIYSAAADFAPIDNRENIISSNGFTYFRFTLLHT